MKRGFLLDIFVSAIIGIFVGLLFMVFFLSGPQNTLKVLISIGQSALIGIIIGSFSKYIIYPLTKGVNKYTKYLILFTEFGVLTLFFSWLMGVREWYHFIMMVAVVEILGITFFNAEIKYKENLNKKLGEKKDEILNSASDN